MAYVDQNGLILIDEIEASEDVNKLTRTIETMDETLAIINQIVSVNSASEGEVAKTIEASALEMITDIKKQKEAIEAEIKFINETIEKYRIIDEDIKNKINATL